MRVDAAEVQSDNYVLDVIRAIEQLDELLTGKAVRETTTLDFPSILVGLIIAVPRTGEPRRARIPTN